MNLETVFITFSLLSSLFAPVEVPKYDIEEQLSYLAFCESSGDPKAYRANDNGSPSIGLLQFKQKTWEWAVEIYGDSIVEIVPGKYEPGEYFQFRYVPLDIYNPEHQKIMAKAMILDGRYEQHWKVCFAKSKKYFGF